MPDSQRNKELSSSHIMQVVSLSAYTGLFLFFADSPGRIFELFDISLIAQCFSVASLYAAIVTGVAVALRGALSAVGTFRSKRIVAGLLAIVGFVLCLLTACFNTPIISIAFGVLFGSGFTLLGIDICFHLSAMKEYVLLRKIALAGIFASLIKVVLLFLPISWLSLAIIILIALSSLPAAAVEIAQDAVVEKTNSVEMTKNMIERNWVLFIGLIICMSLEVLMWKSAISGEVDSLLPGENSQLGVTLGCCIASLAFFLLFRNSVPETKAFERFRILMPIIPLICVTSMLLVWVMSVWGEGMLLFGGYDTELGRIVGNIPVGFSIMAFFFLLIRQLTEEVRRGLSAFFVFGLFIALIATSFLLYTSLQFVLTLATSRIIDLVLKIVYLLVAAIYMFLFIQRENRANIKTDLPFDNQIQEVSKSLSLTKRETEILSLLAQGHSVRYIAEVEFITSNTVKTHIKRLYSKAGVHNREELLNIVYGDFSK